MNDTLINNINARVKKDDRLIMLGDIGFAETDKMQPLLGRIECEDIWLTPGNHDNENAMRSMRRWAGGPPVFKRIEGLFDIKDEGRHVVACHYAMRVWNRSHRNSYMLYGHSHGSLPGTSQSLDVGVDCWDYKPVTLDECIKRMKTLKPYRNEDYHGKRDD